MPVYRQVAPVGIALVPCDNIFTDSTGKMALVGLFNRISVPKFPIMKSKICIYASVTDVYPETQLKVDIVNAETDIPVFAAEGPMDDSGLSPMTICDMIFELHNVIFVEPGTYYARLFGNGTILLQRPFELVIATRDKPSEEKEGQP